MAKIKFLLFLVSILILTCNYSPAQTAQSVIETANELTQKGRPDEAQVLLERFHRANPKEYKITVACAQISYLNKKYDAFMDLYDEAIEAEPKNFTIKLDYAKMLFAINEFEKSLPIFNEYLTYDPVNIDALFAVAKIYKNYEDYDEASLALSKVLRNDPTNVEARDMYTEVKSARSTWVKLTASYVNDSQPLDFFSPALEGGMYRSPLTSLKASIIPILFLRRTGENVTVDWIKMENRSFVKEVEVGVNYGAGLIRYPGNEFDLTGKVRFDKYAERYILLTLGAERKPYLNSLYSLDSKIMVNAASASLTLITKSSWNGKGEIETGFFEGLENPITTVTSYILTPKLKVKDFNFKLGYGLNLSTSKIDKFVSDKTDAQIISSGSSAPYYSGTYFPYYTPKNQLVNNAIVSIEYNPVKETRAGLYISYGFIAAGEKPYYFRDSNPAGDVYVSKGYSSEDYHPLDVRFSINSYITPKIDMSIDYLYSKNFFYITRSIAFGVKVNFWR